VSDELPELPRGVALAWGVAANPQRGPKRELSIEGIVDAAIEIADGAGLGAVSMSSVAAALGYTPMSLYRYVSAKDDLLLLMQEQAMGAPPETIAEAADWRIALETFARETLVVFGRHPWILEIPVEGSALTPNNLLWLDAALQALAATPLDEAERIDAVLAVIGAVRWEASTHPVAATRDDEDEALRERMLAALVTAEKFPALRAAIDAGAFRAAPTGSAFGLDRLLDGIGRRIAEGAGTPAVIRETDPVELAALADNRVKDAGNKRREAEGRLREARQKEREALRAARERLRGR